MPRGKSSKVDLKPIGKAIRDAVRALRKARRGAGAAKRKDIDITIRSLQRREEDVRDLCKHSWSR
jgi:hypothetical protein